MDIICENCGEPWDHNHVLDVLPGIRGGSLTNLHLLDVVKDTEGSWWKFHFLYREQLFEANYMILLCPACEPDVGMPGCKACFGHGRVVVYSAPACTSDHRLREGWHYKGLVGNVYGFKWYNARPFRRIREYVSEIDGRVYESWGFCPECFRDLDEYVAAAKKAGWTEPEPYSGILHKMARERKENEGN